MWQVEIGRYYCQYTYTQARCIRAYILMPNTAVNERKSLSQFPLKSHGLHTIMNRTSRFGRRKNISTDPKCGNTKASYDDEALFNF